MTVLFVAYGMAGGLHAAVLTDFIQGVLTICLLLPAAAVRPQRHRRAGGPARTSACTTCSRWWPRPRSACSTWRSSPSTAWWASSPSRTPWPTVPPGRTELDGQVGFMCGNFDQASLHHRLDADRRGRHRLLRPVGRSATSTPTTSSATSPAGSCPKSCPACWGCSLPVCWPR